VYSHIRAGSKRILGVAPTGAGKTLISAQIVQHAASKGRRTLFVVHRDILISQSAQKLCVFGINPGFIKSGWQENRESFVQVASVQTLCKRDWWHDYAADVVILDECHILAFASVVQRMMTQIYPQAIYLGLSATPWRLKKREGLGDIFQSLVSAPMPHVLIDQAFLVKPSYFSVTEADLASVGTTVSGDFDEGQLALACDRPELIEQVVAKWHSLAYGRTTIAFTINVLHAKHLAEAFQVAGISSAYVSGSTPAKDTGRIYQQLGSGELKILCSCMKLTEGFDVCSVSAILLCRPTMSKALYFQMVGRGLRLSPETDKRDCVVIDQAGNVQRHGYIEELKEISLDQGEEPQETEAPKKICPTEKGGCGAILYAFHMKCSACGYVFEIPKKVYLVPGLEHLISEEDLERYEFYRNNLHTAYDKGFAPGWAAMIFKEKYGHWPPDSWAKGAVFGNSPTAKQRSAYYEYLRILAQRKEKLDTWIQRYIELEFGFERTA